jgi:hypothetical protein
VGERACEGVPHPNPMLALALVPAAEAEAPAPVDQMGTIGRVRAWASLLIARFLLLLLLPRPPLGWVASTQRRIGAGWRARRLGAY